MAGVARSDREDALAPVLAAVGLSDGQDRTSRRAGASFCLHADDERDLARFRRLWRLVVGLRYPGVEFSDSELISGDGGLAAARRAYAGQTTVRENTSAFLPPSGHPFLAIDPRSGQVAVGRRRQDTEELLDIVGAAPHAHDEALTEGAAPDRLARSFLQDLAEDGGPPWCFPRHFEPAEATAANPAFPFIGRDERVGVIHADISGLGQIFRRLMQRASAPTEVQNVATAIEGAIAAATRAANAAVVLPHAVDPSREPEAYGRLLGRDRRKAAEAPMRIIPARPILLGGDDLTAIVRADLAIPFAQRFLLALETETAAAFERLGLGYLPGHLSACAGIAIVSAGSPFLVGARLSEGLCASAKTRAKDGGDVPFPSFLEFAVVTSTIDESLESWRSREQTVRVDVVADPAPLRTTAGSLRAAGGPAADSLDGLVALAEALEAAPGRGKLMEAMSLRHDSRAAAQAPWARFWQVLAADDRRRYERLLRALRACCPSPAEPGAAEPGASGPGVPDLDLSLGAVSDALELIDIGALRGWRAAAGAPRP